MRRLARGFLGLGIAVLVSSASTAAHAYGPGDGLYGRFDGDLTLAANVGGGASLHDGTANGSMLFEARARYLDAAGLVAGAQLTEGAGDVVVLAVEVRPLFPALFLRNLFTGYEVLDATLQSIGIELGAAMLPLESRPRFGIALGGGLEVRLWRSNDGLRFDLRIAARHVRARASDQKGPAEDHSSFLICSSLVIAWSFDAGLASWERPRYER